MQNLKKNLGRYLGIVMAALLVFAALYLPQGWFALRDAASQGRVQREALVPLTVAQLDRSYERDIYQRMCAFMEAFAAGDVNCSTKVIDPDSEVLWENIRQTENGILLGALIKRGYLTLPDELGEEAAIESCTQYVLMRQSDGQILLMANDIRLDKGNGCSQELLIDGVDGTIYYLYSEEIERLPSLWEWIDYEAWDWWWLLNDTYHTETTNSLRDLYGNLEDETSISINDGAVLNVETGEQVGFYDPYSGRILGYPAIYMSSVEDGDVCSFLLDFEKNQNCWTIEIEEPGREYKSERVLHQIRLGLPDIVNSIPGMAERISLSDYNQIVKEDASFQIPINTGIEVWSESELQSIY